MLGTRPTQVSNVPAGTSLFALIRTDIGIHEVRTQRQILIRAGTSPGGLTTRRSEVAQRAADCRGVRIGLACRRSVPQLLWDCPEPQGASKHGRTSSSWAFAGCPGPHGIFRNPGMALAAGAAPFRRQAGPVSPGVRGRQAAWQLADSGRARADQAALARQRRRPPRRRARPAACVKPGEFHSSIACRLLARRPAGALRRRHLATRHRVHRQHCRPELLIADLDVSISFDLAQPRPAEQALKRGMIASPWNYSPRRRTLLQ